MILMITLGGFLNFKKGNWVTTESTYLVMAANAGLIIYVYLKPLNFNALPIGESEYDEQNTGGGIIFPEIINSDYPEIFQIFNTGYNLP